METATNGSSATTEQEVLARQLRIEIEEHVNDLYSSVTRLYMLTEDPFHLFKASQDSVIIVEAKIVKPDVVYATMPKPAPVKAPVRIPPAPEKKKAQIARLTAELQRMKERVERLEQWKEASREIAAGDDW